MSAAQHPAPVFGLGRPSVDFVFTGGAGERARWETWHRPADVGAWFARSSLAVPGLRFGEADLERARELREALWLAVRALAHGERPPRAAVATVNRVAATPSLVPAVDERTLRPRWVAPRPEQALSTVARDAVALLTGDEHRRRVRECANPQCSIVFYDDSRPGTRRWCLAQRCGDRMRARAYRARRGAR